MILVLFEVTMKKTAMKHYLSLAADLKNELEQTDGFIRSERFSSLNNEGKLLSVSFWENEDAVKQWRNNIHHRMSQQHGHDVLFEHYTITIAAKIRQYSETNRTEVPEDSQQFFTRAKALK